jgi:hypothetical protein
MATKSPGIPAAPVINSGLMSNHEQFHVVYDGPALDEHRMNIRDLAPALVAIADLFSAANTELNGNSADVRVEVKGNFKSGSFQIGLIFTQALLVQLRDMFASSTATAVSNASAILAVVGLVGGGGLIGFLRQLRGRRPEHIEDNGESFSVWMTETEVVEVSRPVFRLYKTRAVRVFLQKALSPLGLEASRASAWSEATISTWTSTAWNWQRLPFRMSKRRWSLISPGANCSKSSRLPLRTKTNGVCMMASQHSSRPWTTLISSPK